jgi:hypothetical protein
MCCKCQHQICGDSRLWTLPTIEGECDADANCYREGNTVCECPVTAEPNEVSQAEGSSDRVDVYQNSRADPSDPVAPWARGWREQRPKAGRNETVTN